MSIEQLTEGECLAVLGRSRLGRLGCARDNQPYVVPIHFVQEGPYLYGFTTPGQKVEWMRSNPLVCVELDEVEGSERWLSVVIFGRYEELPETREEEQQRLQEQPRERLHAREIEQRAEPLGGSPEERERLHAIQLLNRYAQWWEPGSAASRLRNPAGAVKPVFYRIHIDHITGRRATPTPGSGPARPG
jgi:nitroimidazol reductase NimA-like FMN-containing flavoprotein (pyridoxamine 5'-phosphate oxidase superfamily)